MRSAAVPSRTLREANQPTAMKAAYMATTAAIAGVTPLVYGDMRPWSGTERALIGSEREQRIDSGGP